MAKFDFEGLRAQLHADIQGTLEGWLPGGRKEGHEYVVENPTRGDMKRGSFKINLKSGQWSDFATNENGGDLISLYKYLKGHAKMGDAYKELQGGAPDSVEATQRRSEAKKKRVPDDLFTPFALPDDAPAMPTPRGKPDLVSVYRDELGRPLFRVTTYRDAKTGRKSPIPTSWGRRVWPKMRKDEAGKDIYTGDMHDRVGWHDKWIPEKRIILNLDQVMGRPAAVVVMGEGEKVANRLAKLEEYVATTWSGGCQRWEQSDYLPLSGRIVVLLPDYDQGGLDAMLGIGRILIARGATVRMAWEPLDEMRHEQGWDTADEANDDRVRDMIEQAMDFRTVENLLKDKPKQVGAEAKAELKTRKKAADFMLWHILRDQEELRCLGYGGDNKIYFINRIRGVICGLTPDQLGNNNHLLAMLPLDFWYAYFPDKAGNGSIDKYACSNALHRWADEVGYFNPDTIRGSGVWLETDGSYIFHMGQELLVEGNVVPISEYKSSYMYEKTQDLGLRLDETLSTDRSRLLLEFCQFMDWDLPVHAHLLAGFCVVAPICGGLDWRPHVWVTGASGSGKSTVMLDIVKRMMGRVGLHVKGDTTAPGLRIRMGSDARPVVFDEFEGETPQRLLDVQKVLELARQASSEDDAVILKGSGNGDAVEFKFRSCMAFSGINVNMQHYADKTRISVLSLKEPPVDLSEAAQQARDEAFDGVIERLTREIDSAYVNAMHMRAFTLLPVIRENAKIFGKAISMRLKSRRLGDQLGILCAGAWALTSAELVRLEQAKEWVDTYEFERVAPVDDQRDHDRCLSYILQSVVKMQNGHAAVERTLGELVGVVMKNALEGDNTVEANRVLHRHGLRVDRMAKQLAIANNHSHLERILKGTPYASWKMLMMRIRGAVASEGTIRFGTSDVSRAVLLPLDVVMHELPKPAPPPPPVADY